MAIISKVTEDGTVVVLKKKMSFLNHKSSLALVNENMGIIKLKTTICRLFDTKPKFSGLDSNIDYSE